MYLQDNLSNIVPLLFTLFGATAMQMDCKGYEGSGCLLSRFLV
jgi:hypothetical protein